MLFVFLICGAFIVPLAQAQTFFGNKTIKNATLHNASFIGPTHLRKVTAESLSVMGPLEFHDLRVTGDAEIKGPVTNSESGTFGLLKITGPFIANDVACEQLDVEGPVNVSGLRVSDETNIVGPLEVRQSQFQGLNILADEISLEDVDVNDINVDWVKAKHERQVLRLKGNTIVMGNIVFKSGKGIIKQGPNVKIRGEITGATVEKK